jgi:Tfp pilus assembly protein FimT
MKNIHGGKSGITLIELLIAISILLLMSGLTIPAFKSYQSNLELGTIGKNLTSDLRFAQQLTVTQQIDHAVHLNLTEKKYEIIKCLEPEEIIQEKKLSEKVEFYQVNGFSNNRVEFNPYGAAKESGSIILINDRNETLTIEVKPSGYVKIVE